jgi:3-methyladenine DNA glycosylase AlkD
MGAYRFHDGNGTPCSLKVNMEAGIPELKGLRVHLLEQGRTDVAQSLQRFFKYPVLCYGIPASELKIIARHYAPNLKDKVSLWKACSELWQSQYQEEALIACDWALRAKKHYTQGDFSLFETWMSHFVNNWATCDTLGNHPMGSLLLKYPELVPKLYTWAASSHPWLKRGAAVSLIVPARKGHFWPEAQKIIQELWEDPDPLVQKGYGWLLKTYSVTRPHDVVATIENGKNTMPRTALRYAIEKLDAETRKELLQ